MLDINKYSSIIWDWNGTVIDDTRVVFDIYREESELYNLEKIDFEQYRKRFYFPVSKFYEELGLPTGKYAEIADRFGGIYRGKWQEINVHPQVYEYLRKFRDAGLSQFVLSAYEQNELMKMVNFFDLQDYFQEVAGVYDNLAHSKIERGKKLLQTRGIIPEKTLMFGDTHHDFEVAAELGIDIAVLAWGTISYEKLTEKCGDKAVFRSLDELFEKANV
jgi:phosphoglycolate phosphatase